MSSEEIEPDVDLPVAAVFVENTEETYYSDIYFSEEGFNRDNTHDLQYFKDSDVHNVVECTRRSDAEAAIAKERSRSYDEGFFEGRQSREEEILDKMTQIASDNWGGKYEATKSDWKNAWQTLCAELEEEVEEE